LKYTGTFYHLPRWSNSADHLC